MKDIVKSIRYSEELNSRIIEDAKELNMTPSEYIRLAIENFLESDFSENDKFKKLKNLAKINQTILNKANRVFVCISGKINDGYEMFYDEAKCIPQSESINGKDIKVILYKDNEIIGKFFISSYSQIELKEKITQFESDSVYINKLYK